jgi:integrase
MPLKLVKRPKSPNWIMRGTVRRQSIEETTGVADRKTAEEIRIRREAELLTESVHGKALTVTFAHAALDYLEHGGGNRRFIKPVADHFGTALLKDINQHAIDLAAAKLYPKGSPGTRNRQVYTPASAILQHAARKGWCTVPNLARPKSPTGVVRWLKPDEADKLLAACAPHLKPLVTFLLLTGARAGEALFLDWQQVDLDKGQVSFIKTKNGEARSVPLHARAREALSALPHRTGEVFLTPAGTPYARPTGDGDTSAGSRIGTAFQGACRRAGIADFRVHDCRHSWASWHYMANRDLAKLQHLGGWKSPAMVFRYAHSNVDEHADSIAALPWGKSGDKPKANPENAG